MKLRKFEISLLMALFLYFAGFVYSGFGASAELSESVIRVHIIANSNDKADQDLKLLVRDRILKEGARFIGGSDREDAILNIERNSAELQKIALDVIHENGFDYGVNVCVDNRFFPTKDYGDFAFPAGNYDALCIEIGDAAGENWWCVAFPPLCTGAATEEVFSKYDVPLESQRLALSGTSGDRDYEIRFKLVEVFNDIKNQFE